MLTKPKKVKSASLLDELLAASRRSPARALRLLCEMAQLRAGAGMLGLNEYFYYQLEKHAPAEQARYAGWRLWRRIERAAIPERWWAVMEDKLILYGVLENLGFPTPRVYAILQGNRRLGRIPSFAHGADLAAHLRSAAMPYPFFAKPVATGRGEGIAAIESYEATDDALVSVRGERIGVADFVDAAAQYASGGYLLQERLLPHARIAAVSGNAVSTARIVVAVGRQGPFIASAAWRIPVGTNIVDNFSQSGNLLGGVALDSGVVRRVTDGTGRGQRHLDRHPTSGAELIGFELPDWRGACELALECAAVLPEIRLQAWDIGLCEGGPKVIEANVAGDVDVPQIANGRGVLDAEFCEFLRDIGMVLRQ